MIVLCYGITKSGSTLAFELVKALLEARGFPQRLLARELVRPGHPGNFVVAPEPMQLQQLSASLAPGEIIAVKLHGDLPASSAVLLSTPAAHRAFRVLVSYRDPREVCLSLMEAAEQNRAREPAAVRGFGAVIKNFDDAIHFTAAQLAHCLQWASVPGALPLYYEDVAFGGNKALVRMAAHLGLAPFLDDELTAIGRQLREDTNTLRNKAVPGRYRELGAEREAQLLQAIPIASTFIERACQQRDDRWLADTMHRS